MFSDMPGGGWIDSCPSFFYMYRGAQTAGMIVLAHPWNAGMEQGKKSREHFPYDDYNVCVRRWTDNGTDKRERGTD